MLANKSHGHIFLTRSLLPNRNEYGLNRIVVTTWRRFHLRKSEFSVGFTPI
jgi:hypothetical protein